MSLREDILNLPKRTPTPVEVPEWGVTLYATFITAAKQHEVAEAIKQYPDAPARAIWTVFGIQDENGKQVFCDLDIPAVSEMPQSIITKLSDAVLAQDNEPAKN